tara:strand:+ start:1289 stop:1573 length:285 start_codon:yes stop_codon:yes gene_type:complete
MNNFIEKEIVWSKGKTKKEMSNQTFWSSSKDCSGLSGLEVRASDFNTHVVCTAITSQGRSHNKYFQIPVDKIEEFCDALMEAKQLMDSKKNETI